MDTEADLQLLAEASMANPPAIQVDGVDVGVQELMDIVDVQKVEEDPELALRPPDGACNEVDLDEAVHEALRERRKNRPVRTIRGYQKGLRCWKVWKLIFYIIYLCPLNFSFLSSRPFSSPSFFLRSTG